MREKTIEDNPISGEEKQGRGSVLESEMTRHPSGANLHIYVQQNFVTLGMRYKEFLASADEISSDVPLREGEINTLSDYWYLGNVLEVVADVGFYLTKLSNVRVCCSMKCFWFEEDVDGLLRQSVKFSLDRLEHGYTDECCASIMEVLLNYDEWGIVSGVGSYGITIVSLVKTKIGL